MCRAQCRSSSRLPAPDTGYGCLPPGWASAVASHAQPGSKSADKALAKRVRRTLAKSPGMVLTNISIRAKDGAVTLNGSVPVAALVDQAGEIDLRIHVVLSHVRISFSSSVACAARRCMSSLASVCSRCAGNQWYVVVDDCSFVSTPPLNRNQPCELCITTSSPCQKTRLTVMRLPERCTSGGW
jgi:hypothetical protein